MTDRIHPWPAGGYKDRDILLINPPLAPATNPYIAIPTLAAYLKSKGLRVGVYDLNRELFNRMLSPQKITTGLTHCIQRFNELNGKPELDFLELTEMKRLVFILSKYPFYQEDIDQLSEPMANFDDVRQSLFRHIFTLIATMPYFPEFVVTSPITSLISEMDPWSGKDILNSLDRSNVYIQTMRQIIHTELKDRLPRCVGISVPFTTQIIPAFQCAKIIRELSPWTHITMGGPCISIYFREINNQAFFDIVDSLIMDEGEIPLNTLVRELSGKETVLSDVPGLVYRVNHEIHRNPTVPPVNLEKLPPPDYSIFPLDNYLNPVENMTLTLRLSRGCHWGKCSFCRTRLPMTCNIQQPDGEAIYKNIRTVISQTGIRRFFFSDESTQPEILEYVSQNLLKDRINITWKAHARISRKLTSNRCKLFKDAGCKYLNLGIESFSDRILNSMKKGITSCLIDDVLKEINGVIPLGAYMMVGYPTETEDESLEGYKKICGYRDAGLVTGFHYSIFTIAYGSEIWANLENYGISHIYTPPDQDLMPDIYIFKSSGMSREKAFELSNQFNGTENILKEPIKELHISDKTIRLRYDLSRTQSMEGRRGEMPYMPYVKWLKKMNQEFLPLKPVW
ncbi:MAG: B12-binding domain-containing radical SAM protein [Candidatus Omnitrophota bacterium]